MSDDESVERVAHDGVNDELPNQDLGSILGSNNAYKLDGTIHVVYDDRLWRRTGQTHNPREIALSDGVAWEGHILTVHIDDGLIQLQHRHAGIQHELVPHERTRWCYVTFEEVSTLDE